MHLPAPAISNETQRLSALNRLELLDSPPDPELDLIVELAAEHFDVPVCLISLVDSERQWFKAKFGLAAEETDRAPSFCGHAIADNAPFVIEDAWADYRFADNPLVTGEPHVRFYAGVPLTLNLARVGTICIIDTFRARRLTPENIASLEKFGRLVEEMIDARTRRLRIIPSY